MLDRRYIHQPPDLNRVFGFHLQHLDVRQESARHTEAVAEILSLRNTDYGALDENERLRLLAGKMADTPPGEELPVPPSTTVSSSDCARLERFLMSRNLLSKSAM